MCNLGMSVWGCSFNWGWKAEAIKEMMCVYAKDRFRRNICSVEDNDRIQKPFTSWQDTLIEKYRTRGTWTNISQKSVLKWSISIRCSDLLIIREIEVRATMYPFIVIKLANLKEQNYLMGCRDGDQ